MLWPSGCLRLEWECVIGTAQDHVMPFHLNMWELMTDMWKMLFNNVASIFDYNNHILTLSFPFFSRSKTNFKIGHQPKKKKVISNVKKVIIFLMNVSLGIK